MIKDLIKQFKQFAMKGNMIDMAVGIIIGASFGGVVNSMVKDLIMPPISLLLAKVNFSGLFFVLKHGAKVEGPYVSIDAAQQAGAVTLNIGNFLNSAITFTITAMAVFILIKFINTLKYETAPAVALTKDCTFCKNPINVAATKCPNCTADLN